MELFMFIGWLAFSVVAAVIAGNKGRSGVGFFLLSLLLSPLLGIIAALIARPNQAETEAEQIASGDMRKCPYCAELVRTEAIKCKHCQSDLPSFADTRDDDLRLTRL